jgi:hypothetical protein
MATLAAVNDTLLEVSQNTEKTSKGISAFVKYLEEKKRDELEAEREAKAARTKMLSQRSSSSSKSEDSKSFLDKFSPGALLAGGGLLGLGARVGKSVLRKLPGLGLIGFADEIADAILGDDFPKDFKDTVSRGIQGAGFGMLLGRRFIPIFTALGLLATEENKDILKDIGENAKEKWDKFAKDLEPILGFLPSLDNILKFIGSSATKGLKAIRGFTESGFNNEEFKNNWVEGVGLLGSVAFLLMPGKFMKALKFLAAFALGGKGKILKRLVTLLTGAAAGKIGYDLLNSEDPTFGDDMADFAAGAALVGGGSYLGFKTIKGLKNRGVPTADQDAERAKQFKNRPVQIVKKGGEEFVKSKKGDLYKRGTPQANMIESKGGTQDIKVPSKFERFAKFMKFPGIAALLAGYDIYGILNSNDTLKEKTQAMGKVFGGILGSGGGAALGAALGSVFPGPGTLLGGLLGGASGYFAGEYLGDKLAKFLLGNVKEDLTGFKNKKEYGLSPGQQQAMTGSPIGVKRNTYNEKLKNDMYNMAGIGNAGIANISTGNKVNSDNTTSTTNTSVSNTSVSSRGGVLDLQDQFGWTVG